MSENDNVKNVPNWKKRELRALRQIKEHKSMDKNVMVLNRWTQLHGRSRNPSSGADEGAAEGGRQTGCAPVSAADEEVLVAGAAEGVGRMSHAARACSGSTLTESHRQEAPKGATR